MLQSTFTGHDQFEQASFQQDMPSSLNMTLDNASQPTSQPHNASQPTFQSQFVLIATLSIPTTPLSQPTGKMTDDFTMTSIALFGCIAWSSEAIQAG